MTESQERRYGPTSGLVTGWVGLAGCAAVAVALPFTGQDRPTLRFAVGAGLAAVVIWAFVVRPRIVLGSSTLRLRNALHTWEIPLGIVDGIVVGVVTRVEAAGRSYDGVAVGRPLRAVLRSTTTLDLVADTLVADVEHAATTALVDGPATGQVERTWAVPELSALGVLGLVLVILFL